MRCLDRIKLLAIVVPALLATALGTPQATAAVIYQLSFPAINVSGTITTDGNTGTLSATDITDWQINQTVDTVHFQSSIDASNSIVSLTAGALTATATGLFFNFSSTDGSKVNFSTPNLAIGGNNSGNGGLSLQFCDSVAACLNQNGASLFSTALLDLVAPGCCGTSGGIQESGLTEIAAATVSTTPLPATLPLFATGFGLVGLLSRRKKRKIAAAQLLLPGQQSRQR